MKAVASEHDEQRRVAEWLEWQRIPFFAVPNGARVRPNQARKLKAEGMRAGVPDLILPVHRIAIEMKRRDASPSDTTPEQREWIQRLSCSGWEARVCRGADEAIEWLRNLGMERMKRVDDEAKRADAYIRREETAGAIIGTGRVR